MIKRITLLVLALSGCATTPKPLETKKEIVYQYVGGTMTAQCQHGGHFFKNQWGHWQCTSPVEGQ